MTKEIAVDVDRDQTRVAVMEDRVLTEIYIEKAYNQRVVGNIYKGKVVNVLPGMQAAFVDIGLEKNAFLYVDDVYTNNFDEEGVLLDDSKSLPVEENRPISIKDVLREGQEIMIQVIKEPIGTKGARVTTHITLPGRYLVLMPTVDYIGISRRIESETERARLKAIAEEIKPPDMGLIVRTVAEDKGKEEISQDMDFLLKLWKEILNRKSSTKPGKIIHKDYDLLYRIVRDLFSSEVDKLYINSRSEYEKVLELLDFISPHLKPRVVFYNRKDMEIFEYFDIEDVIYNALNRKVWLKSGGYLVIDQTEALTAIDVNTGKFVGNTDLEDTVLKTNLEAAKEIAYQIRLRDIGGIIIIDFIDMNSSEHQKMVIDTLEEEVKKDKTKVHVLGLTQLGLVELTRKKVRQGLGEVLQKTCPYCNGKGKIISEDTMAKKVEKELKKIFRYRDIEAVLLELNPNVAAVVIGSGGNHLNQLEEEFGRSIYIRGNENVHPEDIKVKIMGSKAKVEALAHPVREGQILELLVEGAHVSNPRDGIARINGYIVDIENAGNIIGEKVKVEIYKTFRTYAKARLV